MRPEFPKMYWPGAMNADASNQRSILHCESGSRPDAFAERPNFPDELVGARIGDVDVRIRQNFEISEVSSFVPASISTPRGIG